MLFAAIMLGTLRDAGRTRIGAVHVFRALQQLFALVDVRHVSRRTYHAMHQARFVIDADVGLHAKVILVALLGLVHLWVALAVFVLGRTRRIDQRGIDDGALAQRQATVTQVAIDNCQDASSQFVFLPQQDRKSVVSGKCVAVRGDVG